MRFKFVFLTSLLAAALAISISIAALILWRDGFLFTTLTAQSNRRLGQLLYLPTVLIGVLSGIFIYRHTARRRKFQAVLAGILVLAFWGIGVLTMIIFYFR